MRGRGSGGKDGAAHGAGLRKFTGVDALRGSVQQQPYLYPSYKEFLPMQNGYLALHEQWRQNWQQQSDSAFQQVRAMHYHDVWTSANYQGGYAHVFGNVHAQLGQLHRPRLTTDLMREVAGHPQGIFNNEMRQAVTWSDGPTCRRRVLLTISVLRTFPYKDQLPLRVGEHHDQSMMNLLTGAPSLGQARRDLLENTSPLSEVDILQWRAIERAASALSVSRMGVATIADPALWQNVLVIARQQSMNDPELISFVSSRLQDHRQELAFARDELSASGLTELALDVTVAMKDCEQTADLLGWPAHEDEQMSLFQLSREWKDAYSAYPHLATYQPLTTPHVMMAALQGKITDRQLAAAISGKDEVGGAAYLHAIAVLHKKGVPSRAQDLLRFGGQSVEIGGLLSHASPELARLEAAAILGAETAEQASLRSHARVALVFAQKRYVDMLTDNDEGMLKMMWSPEFENIINELKQSGGRWSAIAADIYQWRNWAQELQEK